MRKIFGLIMVLDGLATIIWGRGFLRWQKRHTPSWFHPPIDFFLAWPEPLLRSGAGLQVSFGRRLLRR